MAVVKETHGTPFPLNLFKNSLFVFSYSFVIISLLLFLLKCVVLGLF
jgi:hypothetical protein